jgi:WD40 repeat protein
MRTLDVGGDVFLLRFLPDGQRLVVATADAERTMTFAVVPLDGDRVPLTVPGAKLDSWGYYALYGNAIAAHPDGETCYIAWDGHLHAFRTSDGKPLPVPDKGPANQVVLSPDGSRLVAAHLTQSERHLFAATTGPKGRVLWRKSVPPEFGHVVGFLPDGERFVTMDGAVRTRSFDTGDELHADKPRMAASYQPQISPDGRYLGIVGYKNMYFWDFTTQTKPMKIGASSSFGDFRSFAFHPNGKTVAVIHGGPTLIKVYDLPALQRVRTWKWKLGPLRSVTFSPDGTLGAAGSTDGRVVVWDVDE